MQVRTQPGDTGQSKVLGLIHSTIKKKDNNTVNSGPHFRLVSHTYEFCFQNTRTSILSFLSNTVHSSSHSSIFSGSYLSLVPCDTMDIMMTQITKGVYNLLGLTDITHTVDHYAIPHLL